MEPLMNKLFLATAAFATLGLAASASAQDDWSDDAGGFGVGVDRAVNGLMGASFRYNLNNQLGFEGIFGMNSSSRTVEPEGGDATTTKSSMMDLSLIVDYRVATSSRAALAGYGGVGFNMISASVDGPADSETGYTDMAVELGLRGEVWLYDFFSIYGRFGITYDPYSEGEFDFENGEDASDGFDTTSGSDISMFRGDLVGLFGFTFWMQ